MIRNIADSFDGYEIKRDWERTKERMVAEGIGTFQNGKAAIR